MGMTTELLPSEFLGEIHGSARTGPVPTLGYFFAQRLSAISVRMILPSRAGPEISSLDSS